MFKLKTRYSLLHFIGLSLLLFIYYYSQRLIKSIFSNNTTVVFSVLFWLWVVLMKFSFVIYIFISVRGMENIKKELGFVIRREDVFPGIAGGLLMFLLSYLISPFLPHGKMEEELPYFVLALNTTTVIVSYTFYVIYASFVEELIFRGFLWKVLRENGVGEVIILIVTSVLFTLAHMRFDRFVVLFLWSLILGLLRMRREGIGVSVIAHVTLNLIVVGFFISTLL